MKKLYLIANNPKIKRNILSTTIDKTDRVIRFNHIDYNTRQYFNGRTDILFLRYNNAPPSYYHGLSAINYIRQLQNNVEVIPIGGNTTLFNKITGMNTQQYINKESIDKIWKVKSASSGLVAITYFLKEYPEYKIVLVGFNFHSEQRNLRIHEFAREKKIVETFIKKGYPIELI